jgi:hypothetical protein
MRDAWGNSLRVERVDWVPQETYYAWSAARVPISSSTPATI